MLEKDIERYLVKKVRLAGGECYKWVCPGCTGVPDRIVTLPNATIIFVELKSPIGRSSPLQVVMATRLTSLGFDYRIIDSKEKVDDLLSRINVPTRLDALHRIFKHRED